MPVAQIQNAFNQGELTALMEGRTDQDKYFSGCRRMLNYKPLVQGPAMRRGGTRFVGNTKNNGRAWLAEFEYSVAQSYVLEFGDLYVRFWTQRGQLLSGGLPYEIVSAFNSASLITQENTKAIRYVQNNDVMWLVSANGTVQPQRLARLGATNWTMTPVPFQYGPFQDVDPTSTVRVSLGATTGATTAYASAAIFLPQYVNTYMYLEVFDPAATQSWEPGKAINLNDYRRYQGNLYQCVGGPTGTRVGPGPFTTGSVPPTHLREGWSDGGATWLYVHSFYSIAKITAVAGDHLSASVTISNHMPAVAAVAATQLVHAGSVGTNTLGSAADCTTRWAFALYNSVDGWPNDVAFFRQRLAYFGPGARAAISQIGDYDDFGLRDGPSVTALTALRLDIAINKLDRIRWAAEAAVLLIGGSKLEATVGEQTTQQVFSATNVKAEPQSDYGSRLVAPIRVGDVVLFIERAGKKLREAKFDASANKYTASDLTVLSEHILRKGVVSMAFAQVEDTSLYCVLEDGAAALLTYNRERGVVAWAPMEVGGSDSLTGSARGFIEDHGVISSPDSRRDDPWFIVRRTVNGATVRHVEFEEDPRLHLADQTEAFFVDAGISYHGAPTSLLAGFDHLKGETLQVLADGSPHPDVVVDTLGQIALQRDASKVHAGLKFKSVLSPMRIETGDKADSSQTKQKSIIDVWIRIDKSYGGQGGPSETVLDYFAYPDLNLPIGTLYPLYSGDLQLPFPGGWDRDGFISIVQDRPLPFTVTAIVVRVEGEDA